jgi:hydrogenase maturation protein HypF
LVVNPLKSNGVVAYHITVTGVVQGVGFRPFVYNLATRLKLNGWVYNHSGGVDIAIEGPEDAAARFITALRDEAPPLAHITGVTAHTVTPNGYECFEIRHSERQEGQYQLISPDVATCPDCLRELFDPHDRRYRYPFINCTNCGPRFTIIDDIPYDRPNTTMRVFPLCDACRAEYDDPANRRFHAQPNACPVCGPHVWLEENERISESANEQIGESANGELRFAHHESRITSHEAAFHRTKELLLDGKIVAIKGLGGFHLACDATNADAVRTLRERKHRPHKPFAIMVATLDDARALCDISPEVGALLTSPQCPIVLLDRRSDLVVDDVAPHQHTLGVMLPSTPLHHILLRDVGRPLVMTSGNLSEEPIAMDNAEALKRLSSLADAFLLHNRDIHARYDDSVVQIRNEKLEIRNGEQSSSNFKFLISNLQFLRRARGYAPFPIQLPFALPQVFAAGPLLKNTFTLTRDTNAFVSQHIGDMENLETLEHYEAALATYQRLFRIQPEAVICDLHPDYLTTRFAEEYTREHDLPAPRRVQHHRAHIAACLTDNGYARDTAPVIGVAFDGTGYGDDGTIWGGEWFIGGYDGLTRAAHLEYLPLPGGDAAIRNPWRIAVAYLHTLLGPERFPAGIFCPSDALMVRQQVKHGLNTPPTSSMGRLFDAVSALLNVCQVASYEAQAAIELEQIAAPVGRIGNSPYDFDVESMDDMQIVRMTALFEGLLGDIERGIPTPDIAVRFHVTIAQMIATVCARIRASTGLMTVALSGGVFQNRLLLRLTLPLLKNTGFDILLHRHVPCNDGGVSLGQAVYQSKAE